MFASTSTWFDIDAKEYFFLKNSTFYQQDKCLDFTPVGSNAAYAVLSSGSCRYFINRGDGNLVLADWILGSSRNLGFTVGSPSGSCRYLINRGDGNLVLADWILGSSNFLTASARPDGGTPRVTQRSPDLLP